LVEGPRFSVAFPLEPPIAPENERTADMENFAVHHLTDPVALARRMRGYAVLASSYDRRGGNHDWSGYLRVEDGAAVLMDAEGPGCITRIWSAHPHEHVVRIFLDGSRAPVIACPFAELFDRLPLSFGIGGELPENYERSRREGLPMGRLTYCPIPFRKSCKITVEPEDDYLYYHVNARLFPPDADVPVFDPATIADDPALRAARSAIEAWESGAPILSGAPSDVAEISLAPGQAGDLFARDGAGIVRGIRIELPALDSLFHAAHLRDHLWLVAHFDDDEPRDPGIRCPVGPFFLDFGQETKPRSLFVGTEPDGGYACRFAMPYASRARLRLVNRSILPVGPIRVSVWDEPADALPADLFRFRATWHVETPFGPDHRDYGGAACRILNADGRDNYEFLNVRAGGHFVGCGLHVDLSDAPTDRASMEGDEMFFIDDDPRKFLFGTGAEDYFNDAWGIRGYVGPLSGDALAGTREVDPQWFGYRLHVADPVPFLRKGRFTLEHGTGNNCSGLYRSVAYWYMDPASARVRTEERRWEEIRNRG
jgi:hypothetical protein